MNGVERVFCFFPRWNGSFQQAVRVISVSEREEENKKIYTTSQSRAIPFPLVFFLWFSASSLPVYGVSPLPLGRARRLRSSSTAPTHGPWRLHQPTARPSRTRCHPCSGTDCRTDHRHNSLLCNRRSNFVSSRLRARLPGELLINPRQKEKKNKGAGGGREGCVLPCALAAFSHLYVALPRSFPRRARADDRNDRPVSFA